MEKDITHRIEYYVRKVAQFGAVHPARKQPTSFKFRQHRLMAYKKRMHELIEEGGYRR